VLSLRGQIDNKALMKTKPKTATVKKRILIVDDEPQVLELFSALLRESGYEVETAENALGAIAAVVRAAPDLILADIQMPIVGGMELAYELKSHIDSRPIPVIAFTGHDGPELREAARKAGYDGFLPKPTKPGVFVAQVAKLLGGA
jgi:CheY-like chemotaxis protein